MAAVRLLQRRPDFRRLWLAEVVSYLGDWLAYVAVSATALQHGEGLLALAAVFVVHNLPHAALAPFAGAMADRMDRRRVMIAANGLQALLALAVAAAAGLGALTAMQLLLLARVSVSVFFVPAQHASVPRLVAKDELPLANTLSSSTWSVTFAVGVGLGGLLTASVGPQWAIVADAATFAAAALLLIGLPPLTPTPAAGPAAKGEVTAGFFAAAVRVRRHDALRETLLAKLPVALATGGGWVALNQLAEDLSGPALLGWAHAVRGVAIGIGPLLLLWLARDPRIPRGRRWSLATAAVLAGVLAVSLATTVPSLLAGAALWGLGSGAMWVATTTRIQQVAPDALLGRLAALDMIGFTAPQSLTALLGALAGDALSTPGAAAWLAVALALGAWIVQLTLNVYSVSSSYVSDSIDVVGPDGAYV